jgi:hypothetical protein
MLREGQTSASQSWIAGQWHSHVRARRQDSRFMNIRHSSDVAERLTALKELLELS